MANRHPCCPRHADTRAEPILSVSVKPISKQALIERYTQTSTFSLLAMDAVTSVFSSALSPRSTLGALLLGVLILGLVFVVVLLIRRSVRHVALHLSDTTALQFVSEFAQLLTYVFGFVLYAHLIPELRALGTALLAGVSVVSVVVGMAAQSTLGNVIAGFSLVLYRQIRVGDTIQISSPLGVVTARVEVISLGFTQLANSDGHELVVPNSVMMGNTIIRLSRGN